MPWAPGAGQSQAVAFVVHPVTWGVQAWARLSTRAAIAGGSFLSVLQESRNCPGAWQGETALAAFLGEGDSCLLHFPGSGGRPAPSFTAAAQGFLQPHPGLGVPPLASGDGALGVVPPSTAQMLRLLGCWVMALFSPASILSPTFWC